ncbi:kinase-like domain-containing protein [Daldinia grandis]|nr:kinase-like domain-containing protein [Daldinia grandis]
MSTSPVPELTHPFSLDPSPVQKDHNQNRNPDTAENPTQSESHGEINESYDLLQHGTDRNSVCYDRGDSTHLEITSLVIPAQPSTESSTDPHERLEDELRGALQPRTQIWRNFISIDKFDQLITRQSVREEIRTCLAKLSGNKSCDILANEVWDKSEQIDRITGRMVLTSRRKIFAVLVLLQAPEKIESFINENLWDKDLPFVKDGTEWNCDTNGHPKKPRIVECLNNPNEWDSRNADGFYYYQWLVMSPVFNMVDGKVIFYHLQEPIILPFERVGERDEEYSLIGGFGDVSRVSIHPAHYYLGNSMKTQQNIFAVKKLRSIYKKDFNSEVGSLKRFSNGNHPHLIKLLATYRHGEHYHLIFPCAEGNLKDFWKKNSKMKRTYKLALWMVDQSKGIANGLKMIHNDEFEASHPYPGSPRKGRHGDIKPENILLFKEPGDGNGSEIGVLKISDFGLSRWHRDISNNRRYTKGLAVSRTYRAPDHDLQKDISQPWDIWTLGCVLLEFLTWYLHGWEEGVDEFSKQRTAESTSYFQEDNFFNLKFMANGPTYGASLKDCVISWIDKLRQTEGCSLFIHDFLELILDGMLCIRPGKRQGCAQIYDKLEKLHKRCKEDESYCFKSAPNEFSKRMTNDSNYYDRRGTVKHISWECSGDTDEKEKLQHKKRVWDESQNPPSTCSNLPLQIILYSQPDKKKSLQHRNSLTFQPAAPSQEISHLERHREYGTKRHQDRLFTGASIGTSCTNKATEIGRSEPHALESWPRKTPPRPSTPHDQISEAEASPGPTSQIRPSSRQKSPPPKQGGNRGSTGDKKTIGNKRAVSKRKRWLKILRSLRMCF